MTKDKKFTGTIVALGIIIVITAIACLLVFFIWGGSKNNSSSVKGTSAQTELSCSEITQSVINKMGYTGLAALENGNISGHFDIPADSITQSAIYISSSSEQALEVDCFKLTETSYENSIKTAVSDHMTSKANGFKDNADQLQLIKNYTCESYNGYVFVVVAENAPVAAGHFRNIIDGKE